MKLENSSSFLNMRKKQEKDIFENRKKTNYLPGLMTIEINITELCNRTCEFCPRVDANKYPNQKLFIEDKVFDKIIEQLKKYDYKSKISFSGFGEPFLNKQLLSYIKKIRDELNPEIIIETNSNGDFINTDILDKLQEAGLNYLYWNLYDGKHQIEEVEKIISQSLFIRENILLRPHWINSDTNGEFGLLINNRSGLVKSYKNFTFPLKKKCNYPFYKMLIDWNGNILCCSNDWGRTKIMGNVMHENIASIWMSESFNHFRDNLLKSDRSQTPCRNCDIDGSLFGENSVKELQEHRLVNGSK